MSKFIVIRKDVTLDPVVIESEGLTLGRLIGNDLALNHPTVSRTHAGIKEIEGDYWIFNLSEANGTLLNGEQIEVVAPEAGAPIPHHNRKNPCWPI